MHETLEASDFTRKVVPCDPAKFHVVADMINQKLQEVLMPGSNVRNLGYTVSTLASVDNVLQIDMLAQEPDYLACLNEMLSKTSTKPGPLLQYNTPECLHPIVGRSCVLYY